MNNLVTLKTRNKDEEFFMTPGIAILLGFCCVALLYGRNIMRHPISKMHDIIKLNETDTKPLMKKAESRYNDAA